jgi:hypothetical protein
MLHVSLCLYIGTLLRQFKWYSSCQILIRTPKLRSTTALQHGCIPALDIALQLWPIVLSKQRVFFQVQSQLSDFAVAIVESRQFIHKKMSYDAYWNHDSVDRLASTALYLALNYESALWSGPGGHHGDEGSVGARSPPEVLAPDPPSLEASWFRMDQAFLGSFLTPFLVIVNCWKIGD